MKKSVLIVILFLSALAAFSQDTSFVLPKFNPDSMVVDTSYWHRGTTLAVNLSQTSLTNWNAGGQNAIAYNALSTSFLNYEKGNLAYSNSLTMSFGQANLAKKGWRKTDDRLYYVSKLSHERS